MSRGGGVPGPQAHRGRRTPRRAGAPSCSPPPATPRGDLGDGGAPGRGALLRRRCVAPRPARALRSRASSAASRCSRRRSPSAHGRSRRASRATASPCTWCTSRARRPRPVAARSTRSISIAAPPPTGRSHAQPAHRVPRRRRTRLPRLPAARGGRRGGVPWPPFREDHVYEFLWRPRPVAPSPSSRPR
jgi:hypothetical protein